MIMIIMVLSLSLSLLLIVLVASSNGSIRFQQLQVVNVSESVSFPQLFLWNSSLNLLAFRDAMNPFASPGYRQRIASY